MIRKLFLLLILLLSNNLWADIPFDFKQIKLKRMNGFQRINMKGSKPYTTQFLILPKSHGNAGNIHKRPGLVRGGNWEKIGYAGNDDKSIEVWHRYLMSTIPKAGEIDIKHGAAYLAVITFKGQVRYGNVRSVTALRPQRIAIRNRKPGPYLIISASDNPMRESTYALASWGSRDDRNFAYTTYQDDFRDLSTGRIRGAIISIQLFEPLF